MGQPWVNFSTLESARTDTNRPFVLGVVYDDQDQDEICRAGEGRGGVTVTLTHVASGQTETTQTQDAGGYSFEALVDGALAVEEALDRLAVKARTEQ